MSSCGTLKELAGSAHYSVAQYYRIFRREHGEQPVRQRKRLLLERAAHALTRSDAPISSIALHANFKSFEGFSRAFRREFDLSPSEYRFLGPTEYRIDPHLRIHFAPVSSTVTPRQGDFSMTIVERQFGAHALNMYAILERAETLSDEQLDAAVEGYYEPLSWQPREATLRTLLRFACGGSGEWHTVEQLRKGLDETISRIRAEAQGYEKDGLWDMTFVDAHCEPPEVFSYGGWFGHMASMQVYRRISCLMALSRLGITDVSYMGPNEYDHWLSRAEG